MNNSNCDRGLRDWLNKTLENIKQKHGKINILITGGTGCGKSSTINAMFGDAVAKVGMTPDPETTSIDKYELSSLTLWDSPGLGDSPENDKIHSDNIIKKLNENYGDNKLIDVALVIVDGSNRDMESTFKLINKVIIPNFDKDRIIVAINKADQEMSGRYWDFNENRPLPKLQSFIEQKELSIKDRIEKDTGVSIMPISYAAGYSDGDTVDPSYNLLKLFHLIYDKTPKEKRSVIVNDINKGRENWKSNDSTKYGEKIKKDFVDDLVQHINDWSDAGGEIGRELGDKVGLGKVGEVCGKVVGGALGAATKFLKSLWPF